MFHTTESQPGFLSPVSSFLSSTSSSSRSDFHDSGRSPRPRKCLLCIEGSNSQIYATIVFVEKLLEKVIAEELKQPNNNFNRENALPCHYFDFMVGAGTGGMITALLSILRYSVQEAKEFIKNISEVNSNRNQVIEKCIGKQDTINLNPAQCGSISVAYRHDKDKVMHRAEIHRSFGNLMMEMKPQKFIDLASELSTTDAINGPTRQMVAYTSQIALEQIKQDGELAGNNGSPQDWCFVNIVCHTPTMARAIAKPSSGLWSLRQYRQKSRSVAKKTRKNPSVGAYFRFDLSKALSSVELDQWLKPTSEADGLSFHATDIEQDIQIYTCRNKIQRRMKHCAEILVSARYAQLNARAAMSGAGTKESPCEDEYCKETRPDILYTEDDLRSHQLQFHAYDDEFFGPK